MAKLTKVVLPVKDTSTGTVTDTEFDLGGGGAGTPEDIGIGYGVCSTVTETDAKTATLEDYTLTKNGFVSIKFEHAVYGGATLNINNEGAKPLYYRGSPLVSGTIGDGDTVTFVYDGSKYLFVSSDAAVDDWTATVLVTGDPDLEVSVTCSAIGLSDSFTCDENGDALYICHAPGIYIFSCEDE